MSVGLNDNPRARQRDSRGTPRSRERTRTPHGDCEKSERVGGAATRHRALREEDGLARPVGHRRPGPRLCCMVIFVHHDDVGC